MLLLNQYSPEFVKSFDNLTSLPKNRIKWGVVTEKYPNAEPLFILLNSFINAMHKLTHLFLIKEIPKV